MKKTLLALALVAMGAASSYAQGTINPLNGTLQSLRVKVDLDGNGVADRNAQAADGLQFSLFWGTADSQSPNNLAGTMTIGTVDGVLVGLPSIFKVATWGDPGTVVSLQIRASNDRGWSAQSVVATVALGASDGPGTPTWSTVTAGALRPLLVTVPEPSTIALGVLGLGSLLLFRRRK